jgi:hypothetical protein
MQNKNINIIFWPLRESFINQQRIDDLGLIFLLALPEAKIVAWNTSVFHKTVVPNLFVLTYTKQKN